ncbi:glutathione peroxidase [Alsobacter metallidurans]|uniref:Glutathione peroxidase n=1 Tax=Alsobacter metallidurans TaxID=340221 RepID=A0A917MG09_9HYPH|nr:glutathione peroxidase [Alsobacter metallidurans]GGH07876.1 glutathione peroxidase [Alsobacter metallidurans]
MLLDRRTLLATLAFAPAGRALAQSSAPAMSGRTASSFTFDKLDGGELRLSAFAPRPILVVNTASFCGFSSQLGGLQALYADLKGRGLTVVGVPSNDFGGQEPGPSAETAGIARQHGVTFPMAAKAKVLGADAHPFFRWALAEKPRDPPRWNFHKYLVGVDGHVAAVFPTSVEPGDPAVRAAIERELAKTA